MKPASPSPVASRHHAVTPSLVLAGILAGVLAGGSALAEPAPLRATAPAASPMPAPAAKPAVAMASGKVLETMDAANYTYARVQTPAGEKWIAGPQTAMKVGDTITWAPGNEMKDFASKSLGRTFESILFVGQIVVGGAPGAAAVGAAHGALSGKAADAPEVKGVAKAEGGMTIAEIYDGRAKLEGKEVVLRGKVVKFNAGIMGRNWLHLRDGSHGAAGDNDLTVTSAASAAVGDTVVVRGKVSLNKDFGFNYRYDLMLEDAKVTVE